MLLLMIIAASQLIFHIDKCDSHDRVALASMLPLLGWLFFAFSGDWFPWVFGSREPPEICMWVCCKLSTHRALITRWQTIWYLRAQNNVPLSEITLKKNSNRKSVFPFLVSILYILLHFSLYHLDINTAKDSLPHSVFRNPPWDTVWPPESAEG